MDQAKPEDQDLPWHLGECGTHADLGCPVRVLGAGVSGVSVNDRSVDAADLAVITAESVRAARPRKSIQTTKNRGFATTGATLETMGQQ